MKKLPFDYHIHTVFCDGQSTPEEMALEAISLGFSHLGFSGHMDADIHMDLPAYQAEIARLREKYANSLQILCGVELDALYDPAAAEGADYIIGSTHFLDLKAPVPVSVDNTAEMFIWMAEEYYSGDYYALAKAYYELEATVYERTKCTFVGHFDLVTRFNDELRMIDETDRRYTLPALEAMEHLAGQGVPFEINCGAVSRGRKKELYPNRFLLGRLREMGGQIFISSDAHRKESIAGSFDIAVRTAIECGFTHVLYLDRERNGAVSVKEYPLDLVRG